VGGGGEGGGGWSIGGGGGGGKKEARGGEGRSEREGGGEKGWAIIMTFVDKGGGNMLWLLRAGKEKNERRPFTFFP